VHHETSVTISTSPAQVWSVLTDVERWPEWTASVEHLTILGDGPLAEGTKVRMKQPRLPSMVWEVTELRQQECFTWESNRGGVATSTDHLLAPGDDAVTVTLRVRQSGPFAVLTVPFTAQTRRNLEIGALALKHRCEAAHHRSG
jgi:uncharacterized membrane protein